MSYLRYPPEHGLGSERPRPVDGFSVVVRSPGGAVNVDEVVSEAEGSPFDTVVYEPVQQFHTCRNEGWGEGWSVNWVNKLSAT